MKFSAVGLIVPGEDENRAVGILKQAGATGLTILKGKGLLHNAVSYTHLDVYKRQV